MDPLLLQSQGVAVAAALLPASCPRRGTRLRRRTRAQANLRQLVSVDDLRQVARDAAIVGSGGADDHAVNGRAPAAGTPTPEGARGVVVDGGTAAQRLREIAEAAADRADMHDIIGRQRDNWNHLLLHATNSLALTASLAAALAPASPTLPALRASAGVLLATAAVTMAAVNRIQPSQLAEEQRNATRLWRQLERDVVRAAALDHGTRTATADAEADDVVQDAMDRVLALDAAYPLPLFPGMLDKFPSTVEPTRWWPPNRQQPRKKPAQQSDRSRLNGATAGNGWTRELEDEMRGIVRVLRAKDEQEYVSNAKLALRLNRSLAVAGPALAGTAALATAFIGSSGEAAGAAVLCGALAAAANTVEHGWQLGMLFDMFRNVAGFYRKIQEDIEACLDEVDVERRENGEVFQTKVALLLGRSTSDLRQFREMASPSFKDDDIKDFAGKLF